MQTLRGPNGCPWDRKQTLPSLKPFVIEESYEVVDAIDRDDRAALAEELGDFLLQAVFIAELTREEGSFDIYDAITAIHDKLVRRHPHVFGDVEANDADQVLVNWEKQKNEERKAENKSVLAGVPQSLPALLRASRLTEKAARVGFDWRRTEDVFDKLDEEIAELHEAIASGDASHVRRRDRRPPLHDREHRPQAECECRGGAAVDEPQVHAPLRVDGIDASATAAEPRPADPRRDGRAMGRSQSRRTRLIAASSSPLVAHDCRVAATRVDARATLAAIALSRARLAAPARRRPMPLRPTCSGYGAIDPQTTASSSAARRRLAHRAVRAVDEAGDGGSAVT